MRRRIRLEALDRVYIFYSQLMQSMIISCT